MRGSLRQTIKKATSKGSAEGELRFGPLDCSGDAMRRQRDAVIRRHDLASTSIDLVKSSRSDRSAVLPARLQKKEAERLTGLILSTLAFLVMRFIVVLSGDRSFGRAT